MTDLVVHPASLHLQILDFRWMQWHYPMLKLRNLWKGSNRCLRREGNDLWVPVFHREVAFHLPARILFPQHSEIKTSVLGLEAMIRAVGMYTSPLLAWFSHFPSTTASLCLILWGWQTRLLFQVVGEAMWQKQSCPVDKMKPNTLLLSSLRQQEV